MGFVFQWNATVFVHAALLGYIPLVICLFSFLPPRKAALLAVVGGYLLLPVYTYEYHGHYGKEIAPGIAVALAALLFDFERVTIKLRLQLIDVPMVLWCFAPALTSASLGDSFHEGLYNTAQQIMTWGLPYFAGRVYFTNLESAQDMALGIVLGALFYLPLVFWELKMSPNLHYLLYGFVQHPDFRQMARTGGWRPMVFLHHALAVGIYLAVASVIAFWLYYSDAVKRVLGIPMLFIVFLLTSTTILCKAYLAIVLMFIGFAVLWVTRMIRFRIAVAVLLLLIPAYIYSRTLAGWSGKYLLQISATLGNARAESINIRLQSEKMMLERRVQAHPYFGCGSWGRSLVYDTEGHITTIPDSFWMIALGEYGAFGLITISLSFLVGPILVFWRIPARDWAQPLMAPVVALAMMLVLHLCDDLFNANPSPILSMAAGAIAGIATQKRLGQNLPSSDTHG